MNSDQVRVLTIAQLAAGVSGALEQMHVQDGNLLLWTTRGQGVITLHGVRHGFSAHNAIFLPAEKIWAADFGRQTLGQAIFIPQTVANAFPPDTLILRVQDSLAQSELTGLIEDMRREILQDRPFQQEALSARANLLAIWLRRQAETMERPKRRKAAERLVNRFCDLAAFHHRSGMNMADYAEMLEVTPTHLTRVCRQTAGMTAADILVQCTVFETKKMLTTEKISFKAISESLGFASPAYFTRFVQQHCGATPTEIRKRSNVKSI